MNQATRIYLIGFMGTGKTHWGRIWAIEAGFSFTDLDAEIENEHGSTVQQLFEKKGEAFFRQAEADALRKTAFSTKAIIACGGGAPCFHQNMEWMNSHGVTVLLDAAPRQIFDRIKNETSARPLLKNKNENELLFFIEQLLKERNAFYRQAKVILPVGDLTNQTIHQIIGLQ